MDYKDLFPYSSIIWLPIKERKDSLVAPFCIVGLQSLDDDIKDISFFYNKFLKSKLTVDLDESVDIYFSDLLKNFSMNAKSYGLRFQYAKVFDLPLIYYCNLTIVDKEKVILGAKAIAMNEDYDLSENLDTALEECVSVCPIVDAYFYTSKLFNND